MPLLLLEYSPTEVCDTVSKYNLMICILGRNFIISPQNVFEVLRGKQEKKKTAVSDQTHSNDKEITIEIEILMSQKAFYSC